MKCLIFAFMFLVARPTRILGQSPQTRTATTSFIPRTCQEGFDSGHPDMKESGMYWIDPDGIGIGQVPIYVYCEKGIKADQNGKYQHKTTLLHNKQATFQIAVCKQESCVNDNEVSFNYTNATNRQMWALAELSEGCEQSIKITLVRDTLEENIWWEDRFGEKHLFWDGEFDPDTETHTCKCGVQAECFDPDKKCNCDAGVAIPLSDEGVLTDKDLLPVTVLHLGKIVYEGGAVTLGPVTCTGRAAWAYDDGQPRSCEDLWALGHTLNGVYTVKNPENSESCSASSLLYLYCDFTNPDGELPELVHETPLGTTCAERIP